MNATDAVAAAKSRLVRIEYLGEVANESGNYYGDSPYDGTTDTLWLVWQREMTYQKSGEPDVVCVVEYSNGSTHYEMEPGLAATPPSVSQVVSIISDPNSILLASGEVDPSSGWVWDGNDPVYTPVTVTTRADAFAAANGSHHSWSSLGGWTGLFNITWNQGGNYADGTPDVDLDFSVGSIVEDLVAFKRINAIGLFHQKFRIKFRSVRSKIPCSLRYAYREKSYTGDFTTESESGDTTTAESTPVRLNHVDGWESDWIEVTANNDRSKALTNVYIQLNPHNT